MRVCVRCLCVCERLYYSNTVIHLFCLALFLQVKYKPSKNILLLSDKVQGAFKGSWKLQIKQQTKIRNNHTNTDDKTNKQTNTKKAYSAEGN